MNAVSALELAWTEKRKSYRETEMQLEQLEQFYEEVKKLCKEGQYNLVLHKHLGDIFYAISLREAFELHTGKGLHFIVRPRYAFLLDMCGSSNYSIYDSKWMEEDARNEVFPYMPEAPHASHHFDMIAKDLFSSVPIMGQPFILDGEMTNFRLFTNYWCRLWSHNLLGRTDFQYPVPHGKVPMSGEGQRVLNLLAPLEKIVLLAPDAATAIELPVEIWDALAEEFSKKGYVVVVNSKKYKIKHASNAFVLGLSLPDVIALGQRCAYVFSLRSGLCDVLVGIGKRLYAFYPAMLRREFGSLIKPFAEPTGVNEVQFYHWKTSPIVWEGEDLTPCVQKELDRLKAIYRRERMILTFSSGKRKSGHQFWSGVFNAVAGEANQFPENNVENPPPREREKEVKVLGMPVYRRRVEVSSEAICKTLLGGLWHERRLGKSKKVCVCGLQVYSRNRRRKKVLGITLKRYDYERRWLQVLAQRIGEEYDDVYLLRHNMGETYVELACMEQRVQAHGSKKPLVVAREERYEELCRMMLPKEIEVRHIPLDQGEIHDIFCEQGKEYREIMFEADGHRFFCSTPRIAEHMVKLRRKDPHVNFYSYIRESVGAKAGESIPRLQVQEETKEQARALMQKEGLKEGKYVVLLPEAVSTQLLPENFWLGLEEELTKRGYKTYINWSIGNNVGVPVEVLVEVSRHAAGVITLGSGVAIVLAREVRHMDIIYTALRNKDAKCNAGMVMELYSVRHIPGVDMQVINEYDSEERGYKALAEQVIANY